MASIPTGPATRGLQRLAIPAVCLLILFLGYYSQWLFHTAPDLAPGPLTRRESLVFNALLLCLWWTYYRACSVDPGRYPTTAIAASPDAPVRSRRRASSSSSSSSSSSLSSSSSPSTTRPLSRQMPVAVAPGTRWCRKCRQPKPPRAHHCRHCRRCIPRMDHHCPWTGNCVSLQTFPHFLRFLVYANAALWYLAARLLYARAAALWAARHAPAYLGPTAFQLCALTVLALLCGATMLALGILLALTVRAWATNTTMIESWEAERHDALLDRYAAGRWDADAYYDYDDDDDDERRASPFLRRVEFPYDLGFFANMAQAMGSRNPLLWLFPLAGHPRVSPDGRGTGWEWPENGLNPVEGMWPPPDPEKSRRARWRGAAAAPPRWPVHEDGDGPTTAEERKAAFRRRQEADHLRRRRQQQQQQQQEQRIGILEELEERGGYDDDAYDVENEGGGGPYDDFEEGLDGEPGWTNAEGERLRDYGVDEEAEEDDGELISADGDDDDDVPIGELLRRRKVLGRREEL